jgi:GAF domain-containing protein
VNQALAQTTDSAAFLHQALNELCTLIKPAFASVLLLSQDGDELSVGASSEPALVGSTLALQSLPAVVGAIGAQTPIVDLRPDEAPLANELGPLLPGAPNALLWFPLIRQGRPIGALLLGAPADAALNKADLALIELIGNALAGALFAGRLVEAMGRRDDQLMMVADIAAHVSSSLETREVYRLVVQKLNEYFRVDAGSLLLKDEATDELIFVMTLEAGQEKLFGTRVPPGAGLAGYVAQTQKVYWSNDVQNDPRHYRLIDEAEALIGIAEREGDDILKELRREMQRSEALRVVMVATKRLAELNDLCRNWDTSPFLYGIIPRYLGRLEPDEARALIRQEQSRAPLNVDDALAEPILAATGCGAAQLCARSNPTT